MINGIPIKGSDDAEYITRTETGSDGRETQVVSEESSWLLRMLAKVFGRLSFDSSSQLRTTVAGSLSTVTTVTTVTTGNMGLGDMGKPATAMLMSRQAYSQTVCANLARS